MTDKLLTKKDVASRWQQSTQTIDRYRKVGNLPWIDLSGGNNKRPVVRFKLSDIEAYEEKVRLQPMPCNKKRKSLKQEQESTFIGNNKKPGSENVSHPVPLSGEKPKLIRRSHANK